MDLLLRDKVAMVAAASRGLGYGAATELAREGARVSICSRNSEEVHGAALKIEKATGASVAGFRADMSDPGSIDEWVSATVSRYGGIDCLIVNAGGPTAGRFGDFDDTQWASAFNLTLMSAVRLIRAVLPSMKQRGGGSIAVITSSSVKEPIDLLLLSNVFRAGVTALAKSLSRELAPAGIRVNNLVPGRIDTSRVRELDRIAADKAGITPDEQARRSAASIPAGRYGSIEEFGRAAAFILSGAAGYITGETFTVDGGMIRTVW